jgi:hypothetical protein
LSVIDSLRIHLLGFRHLMLGLSRSIAAKIEYNDRVTSIAADINNTLISYGTVLNEIDIK